MKRNSSLFIILTFTLLFTWLAASAGFAQLIIVGKKVKVVKIDTDRHRIEFTGVDDPMETLGYAEVTGDTKTTWGGEPFPWWKIKRGWIIGIKGGVRWDGHINVKEIEVLQTSP